MVGKDGIIEIHHKIEMRNIEIPLYLHVQHFGRFSTLFALSRQHLIKKCSSLSREEEDGIDMNPTFLKTGELRHVEEAQEEDEQGWRWRCAGVSRRTQEVDHVCAANDTNRVVEDDRNCCRSYMLSCIRTTCYSRYCTVRKNFLVSCWRIHSCLQRCRLHIVHSTAAKIMWPLSCSTR